MVLGLGLGLGLGFRVRVVFRVRVGVGDLCLTNKVDKKMNNSLVSCP